jgi:hypothetical protein
MWLHDLQKTSRSARAMKRALFEASRALHAIAPTLERSAFTPAVGLLSVLWSRRSASALARSA